MKILANMGLTNILIWAHPFHFYQAFIKINQLPKNERVGPSAVSFLCLSNV
jgi:hypothetical protein